MSGTATRAGQTLAEHVAGLPAELGTVLAAVGRGGLALAGEVRRAARTSPATPRRSSIWSATR
jgi:hypothetical protein